MTLQVDRNLLIGSNNKFIIQGLFYENETYKTHPWTYFTINYEDRIGSDGKVYYSLPKIYLELEDPTEYEIVEKYFYNWAHWEALCKSVFFRDTIKDLRKELEVRLRSKALKEIILEAENGGKNAYQANRFLVTAGWKATAQETSEDGTKVKRGRPSKQEVLEEANRLAEIELQVENDLKRLDIN